MKIFISVFLGILAAAAVLWAASSALESEKLVKLASPASNSQTNISEINSNRTNISAVSQKASPPLSRTSDSIAKTSEPQSTAELLAQARKMVDLMRAVDAKHPEFKQRSLEELKSD